MKAIYRRLGLLCLLITSCTAPEGSTELFLYNEADPYIRLFGQQLMEAAASDLELIKHDAGNSQVIQNEQMEAAISNDPALMVINPVDRLAAYTIIQTLKEHRVPVIFFNREPLVEDLMLWERAYYVGARAAQSGQMQARLVMELFGGNPEELNKYDRNSDNVIQTIVLKGEQGHQDAEARTREGLNSFEKAGFRIEILSLEVANWSRDEAYEVMGTLIDNFGDRIELVLSNNDAMALGAINRMRQAQMFLDTNGNERIDKNDEIWVPVVGIDGLDEAIAQIRNGYLYGTVYNDSAGQTEAIIALARTLIAGGDPAETGYELDEGRYIWIDYQPVVLD